MPSLLKTSCNSCIAAKRRCSRAVPKCERCSQRSLDCQYAFPPSCQANSDWNMQDSVGLPLAVGNCTTDLCLPAQSGSVGIADADHLLMLPPDFTLSEVVGLTHFDNPHLDPTFEISTPLQKRVLELWPRLEDTQSWRFCAQMLLSFTKQFVQTGKNPFIGQTASMPYSLATAFSICATYLARTDATNGIFQLLMVTEVSKLAIEIPHSSFERQLATLQALLLYFTLMLFGGDALLRTFAENQEDVLERATVVLQWQCLGLGESLADSVDDVSHETARRAVVVSYLLRGIYRVLQYKSCHIIPDLLSLPVSLHLPLTLGPCASGLQLHGQVDTGYIVTYNEFVQEWELGRLRRTDDFARLLLVACKGLSRVNPTSTGMTQ
ncbi:uncharacterized protein FFUJ_10119 [Fusarium fujikuroi IMI 58289]|uniref:Zn(2)-C6 fungal-type domain-containing protein n=1 Tax=Gibberella fujikuroi (strain CBS 195.34 / IMI 58289 / NRRL A-6831) TaxID=1279085 RepID=S0EE33_GIBF5|nr:uncharacterized protein FFUJ_10119 [Fusarium fujikuroi IMI 58289]CCT73201.1 uncharacterized protein FFUJ_10119 [Fusarium fujikuroi IMI 58289]SCO16296.1 uncharacterized protein FFM5_11209 [Fusarium fujikuroi]